MQIESHAQGDNQGECLRQYLRPRSTNFTMERKDKYEENCNNKYESELSFEHLNYLVYVGVFFAFF